MVPMPGACKNARERPSRRLTLGQNVESASAARLINTSWYDTASSLAIVPQTRVANRRSPGIPRAGASFCPGRRAELAQILRIQVSAQSRSSGSGSSACRVPMVRIHFPPAESLQTFGSRSRRPADYRTRHAGYGWPLPLLAVTIAASNPDPRRASSAFRRPRR
jgi:hypothetical protein